MSQYRAEKCSADSVCAQMDMRLVDVRLVPQPGFQIVEKLVKKQRALALVVYKRTAKDKPMQINICPWCEGRPGFLNTSGETK